MNRRSFLLGSAKVVAAASTVSYFDIGASVQRHNQLVTPEYTFMTSEALRMLKPVRYTGLKGKVVDIGEPGSYTEHVDELLKKGDVITIDGAPGEYVVGPRTGSEIELLQQKPSAIDEAVQAFADGIDRRVLEAFYAERKALQRRFGGIKLKREYDIEVDHG